MKNTFVAVLFLLVTISAFTLANDSKYTNKYDQIDVDRILQNDRVLTNYIKCLMDEGPCTPEGRELKKTLPDAIETGCEKCNEKQRITAEKVMKHLRDHKQKDWNRLLNKYDPSGAYRKKYEERLAAFARS